MAVAPAPAVEVVNAVPGRVRLRVPALRSHPALADKLTAAGLARPGLRGLRVNPASASVVVESEHPDQAVRRTRALVVECLAAMEQPAALAAEEGPAEPAQDAGDAERAPRLLVLGASLVGLGLTFLGGGLPQAAALGVTAVATAPTLWRAAVAALVKQRPSADQLDTAAIGLMFLAGDVRGAALSRLIAVAAAEMRDFTARRSHRVTVNLRDRLGATAWLVQDGQERRVPVERLAPGDLVAVYARGPIPVDGVVEAGAARVNQRDLTGEGRPLDRAPGDSVYAATVVTEGWLHVRASAVGPATRAGWVVRTLEHRPVRDTRATDYAQHYVDRQVLPAFGVAGLALVATRDLERAAAVLNVDYGTGLEISAPTAILATKAHAAQDGILIRSGHGLERLAAADAVVLDKTGTLTHGRPDVTEVVSLVPSLDANAVLTLAAAAEAGLHHVVARAIVRQAHRQGLALPRVHETRHAPRRGVAARVDGREVHVGNVRYLEELGILRPPDVVARASALGQGGSAVVYVVVDGTLVGLIGYQDLPRREAAGVVAWLREHGAPTVQLVTGDVPFGAYPAARAAGIPDDAVHVEALPEDKAAVVEALQRDGHVVAFVGDGIDDAPALAMADVSVSFGHAADVAQQTADVVLLDRDLQGLVHAIELSRASLGLIQQNLNFVRVSDVLLVALAVAGRLDPAATALLGAAGAAVVEANSLRPLLAPRQSGRHHVLYRRAHAVAMRAR